MRIKTGALLPHERLNESPSEKEGKFTARGERKGLRDVPQ